jgi:hypothetical protein
MALDHFEVERHMKGPKDNRNRIPQYDYGQALQAAVSWLGDRYLLAEKVAPRREIKPFFATTRNWHEAPVVNRIASRKH